MELGKFIAKVISEIKSNIKEPDYITGLNHAVELDLLIAPAQDGKISVIRSTNANVQHGSRIKILLNIKLSKSD